MKISIRTLLVFTAAMAIFVAANVRLRVTQRYMSLHRPAKIRFGQGFPFTHYEHWVFDEADDRPRLDTDKGSFVVANLTANILIALGMSLFATFMFSVWMAWSRSRLGYRCEMRMLDRLLR